MVVPPYHLASSPLGTPVWGPSQLAAHCQMQGPSAGSGCPARWKEVKQQPSIHYGLLWIIYIYLTELQ